MAQTTNASTTSPSRFHSHADPALAGTRRAFIHTIGALSLAAAAPAATAQTLDADLIELGARFEPLVDQYYVTRKHWARSMVAAHAEYRASAEQHYQVLEECCERSAANEAGATLSAINPKMEELANAINAAPVNSIAGLRVKALVAFWKVAPKRAGDTEFSFEGACAFQQLFTAVSELCGLNDKMAAVGYQLPDVTMADDDDIGGMDVGASFPSYNDPIRPSNVSSAD
jgi:hypothetical protein